MKHILSITDFSKKELLSVIKLGKELKEKHKQAGESPKYLRGKTLAMIFEKPSLRTRLSFEIAMTQLGGHAVYLSPSDIGLGTREPIKDIAKVTSSMADGIMTRTFTHANVYEFAKHSLVPVINGLSDLEHPCQILADLLTIFEQKGKFSDLKIAFIGDGNNNVTHSLALVCGMLGMDFVSASPKGFEMNITVLYKAHLLAKSNGTIMTQTNNPYEAAYQADVVYTDTWISMGKEEEKEKRMATFLPFQVDNELMNVAKSNAIFMHDMPAYRGNEVAANVIDGPQSVVYQQAENRLHAQKSLLTFIIR
ncbi:MAG: ornithine carbamoyltransferase [Patescibacteria group bacterium]|nr:ornithine carbamoyltransferase [Patescibacteria group bacterium]MDE2590391.1 ornithine carbamoyltransferase [Patescibacteria group bacterium]